MMTTTEQGACQQALGILIILNQKDSLQRA
jgi:hypothetical protein